MVTTEIRCKDVKFCLFFKFSVMFFNSLHCVVLEGVDIYLKAIEFKVKFVLILLISRWVFFAVSITLLKWVRLMGMGQPSLPSSYCRECIICIYVLNIFYLLLTIVVMHNNIFPALCKLHMVWCRFFLLDPAVSNYMLTLTLFSWLVFSIVP